MKILIVGDIHGELHRFAALLRRAQTELGIHAAIQVGDFGFYEDTMRVWLESPDAPFSVPVHVIDGNHEDHLWLQHRRLAGADQLWRKANLMMHGRGTIARIGGRQFGFCGGALHADRPQEGAEDILIGQEPLAPNWLTSAQSDQAAAVFAKHPPEVMITHSCPSGIGIGMQGNDFFSEQVTEWAEELGLGPIPSGDCGEPTLASLWHRLTIKPRHWLFGHFHTVHQRCLGSTSFTCTGAGDRDAVRPIVLDTRSLQLTIGPLWDMAGMA